MYCRNYSISKVNGSFASLGATGEKPGTDELDGDAKDVSPGVTTISAARTDPVWLKYIEDAIKKTNNSPACPSNACKIQKFTSLYL